MVDFPLSCWFSEGIQFNETMVDKKNKSEVGFESSSCDGEFLFIIKMIN